MSDLAGQTPPGARGPHRSRSSRGYDRLLQPLRSVRVRITLAATLVTALAVFGAAWLLIQSIEDTQLTKLRSEARADLAALEAELAQGTTPRVDPLDSILAQPVLVIEGEGYVPLYPDMPVEVEHGENGAVYTTEAWGLDLGEMVDDTDYNDLADEEAFLGLDSGAGERPAPVPADPDEPPLEDDPYAEDGLYPEDDPYAGADPYGDEAWDEEAELDAEEAERDEELFDLPPDEPAAGGYAYDGSIAVLPPEVLDAYVEWEEEADAPPVVEKIHRVGSYEVVTRTVETPVGQATLLGALPTDEIGRSVDAVRRPLMAGLPLLVLLVGVATWLLVGRSLRPVEAIRAEAEGIEGATIHRRVPEPASGDEVGRLARTMNAMLDRLDGSSRRQRQFVSDASHELRSPVAAIRTDLEVALHEGDQADWPRVARDVLAEEARLEALLDDLLLLATDDEREDGAPAGAGVARGAEQGADRQGVDLVALVADEAGRSRRLPVSTAGERTDAPDQPVTVHGSARLLARLVANLLDNAARHGASRVEVVVEEVAGQQVRLTVDDDGPGIPGPDRARVFERFIRLDEGRARDQGGAGLGLAVVRSIAQRQGGAVWVEDSPLGGARFVVMLPGAHD